MLLPCRLLPGDGCTLMGANALLNRSEPKGTLVPVLASYSVLSHAVRRARAWAICEEAVLLLSASCSIDCLPAGL